MLHIIQSQIVYMNQSRVYKPLCVITDYWLVISPIFMTLCQSLEGISDQYPSKDECCVSHSHPLRTLFASAVRIESTCTAVRHIYLQHPI